ncbi:MAG: hypothetical protein AAB038_05380 [Planctomycetota bacterium]
MHKLNRIEKKIRQIGNRLVKCKKQCEGVKHNLKKGIIPRCLWFDTFKSKNNKGCIVIGINPGIPKNEDERDFYKSKFTLYDKHLEWLKDRTYVYNKGESGYYTKLVNFIRSVGIKGPIHWTDLVKCQFKRKGRKLPPKDTISICTGKFLMKELKIIPRKWPIIAVATSVFKQVKNNHEHSVIGIPHPTGSHGDFDGLIGSKKKLSEIKKLLSKSRKMFQQAQWFQGKSRS